MTSASYPVGSPPASSRHSYLVHLHSLKAISRELQTQADGIGTPLTDVEGLIAAPAALGPFAEASTLSSWGTAAANEMHGLIGDVRSAISFADDVTRTVASGYASADDDVSWGLGGHSPVGTVVGVATGTVGAATGAVGGVTAGLANAVGGTLDGVGDAVGGVAGGALDGVGNAVQGAGNAVAGAGHAAGSILGALTGSPTPPAGGQGGLL